MQGGRQFFRVVDTEEPVLVAGMGADAVVRHVG